jgi:hypothetical protein
MQISYTNRKMIKYVEEYDAESVTICNHIPRIFFIKLNLKVKNNISGANVSNVSMYIIFA